MTVWERAGRAATGLRSPAIAALRHGTEAWIRFRAGLDDCTVDLDVHPYARFESIPSVTFASGTHNVVHIGPGARIARGVRLNLRGGSLLIGEDADVRQGCIFNVSGTVDVGARVVLSVGMYLHCADGLRIGEDTIIGEYSSLVDNRHLRTPPEQPIHHTSQTAPVAIGTNVWMGTKVCIADGVTVGDQCIIAANSVVTKDLPPWSLAGGVPARVLKTLEVDPKLAAGGR